jgi:hypothetical protein
MLQEVSPPVSAQEADALLTSTTLITLQGGLLATLVVSKGLQMILSAWAPASTWIGKHTDAIGKTVGLVLAMAISFYAASQAATVGPTGWNFGVALLAFLNGWVIFASAYGTEVGLTYATGGATGGVGTTAPMVTITPATERKPPGDDHTVTATVMSVDGTPAANVSVTFTIRDGPDVNARGALTADSSGHANWTFQNNGNEGIDTIEAAALGGTGTATVEFKP